MNDREFLLAVLADGRPHSLAEILSRSMNERGCGLTVHSRVADLRKHGYTIEHGRVEGAERGHAHTYLLVSSPQQDPTQSQVDAGLGPGAGLGLTADGSCSEGDGEPPHSAPALRPPWKQGAAGSTAAGAGAEQLSLIGRAA